MRLRFLVFLAIAGSGFAARIVAQEQIPEAQWRRGYHGFAMICRGNGLEPRSAGEWARTDPRKTLLVILGVAERSPLNLADYVAAGGCVLAASDRTDVRTLRPFGIRFYGRDVRTRGTRDAFNGWRDCPVSRRLNDDHPVTRDVTSVVTNRPGLLTLVPTRTGDATELAWLPLLEELRRDQLLMAAVEHESGGRILALADPSVLTNQMLLSGDNARLAWQAVEWLKSSSPERNHLLLVVDGAATQPTELENSEILLPPPTRDEVLKALRNLPPDKLIEFGNTVAAVVEEEGIVNEFLGSIMRDVPPLEWKRFLLLAATLVIAGILWFGFFTRDTLPDHLAALARRRTGRGEVRPFTGRERRALEVEERAWAARTLVDQLLRRITGGGLRGASRRAGNIRLLPGQRSLDHNPPREIRKMARRVRRAKPQWWKPRRLKRLESRIATWRQLHDEGRLVYDAIDSTVEKP